MRAAVVDQYGPPDVVRVVDLPRPEPRPDEVLVRVRSVAVTSADARIRAARFPSGFAPFARLAFGLRKPRRPVLGSAFSGEIAAVGTKVPNLNPGDQVCGMTGAKLGAHAEYVTVRATRTTRKPEPVSHDDAAAVLFGGSTALFFLRDKASTGPGKTVLVNGASGAIGTNAVQIAKHLGATVTAVTSTRNAELVTSLGADHVIDYTTTPVTSLPDRYDVVLDTVGTLSIPSGRRLLTPNGVLALVVADLWETIRARGPVAAGPAPERPADFDYLLARLADKDITAVIDSTYDLPDITEAHRRVDSGRKVGNIVVHP